MQPARLRTPLRAAGRLALFLAVLVAADAGAQVIGFEKGTLAGTGGLDDPTSLHWGPDGRLYVSEYHGLIRIYSVVRNGPADYVVAAAETISVIQQIPNHDDDGTLNTELVNDRQVTGLLVTGTAQNPVLFVGSSDPRAGAGASGLDLGLDTNSGILTRLTWNGGGWDRLDLVVGLPRSEEVHSINGMQLDAATNTLYLTSGGMTNMGAPSIGFGLTPEFALSAAILAIDLDAIGDTTYVLPTLDDEDREGVVDANDPFGGNDGKNQAILEPGGPIQIFASGLRNAYDVVITEQGRMYTVDNGPNGGLGAPPLGEGTAGCTNGVQEAGNTFGDGLHFVTGAGYYAGHPNPTRANPALTFNASNPQSPVSVANPVECDYLAPGPQNGALHVWPFSTNGLAEYTTDNFGGALQGDLLAALFDNTIARVKLDAAGTTATLVDTLFSSVGVLPLDLTTHGPFEAYPGTIWVADLDGDAIVVFEPTDLALCTGADDPLLDEDEDGYDNADEIDNGTSPCSPADVPPDWDADRVSNRNDPDDDDDGLLDPDDPFAVDPANGTATVLPLVYTWDGNQQSAGALLGLGFTGLMTNGSDDYESLFDPTQMTAGGAVGVTTVDAVTEGDARDAGNDQEYGFQFGVPVDPSRVGPFTVRTRVQAPFAAITPAGAQSLGLQVGTGSQDGYVKLVLAASGGGEVEFGMEIGGSYEPRSVAALTLPGPEHVDLLLRVDPQAATVEPFYQVTTGGVAGPITGLGGSAALPAAWFGAGLAVGILSTSRGAQPFAATWDLIDVVPERPACEDTLDNDGDGLVDLADPGCAANADASERGPVLEDFSGFGQGADPDGWFDTGPGSSLLQDDALFRVFQNGFERYFGTTAPDPNIHSHYIAPESGALGDYAFTGRLRITDSAAGIGVTFFSQYPNADAYYRLRRYAGVPAFHLAAHGTQMTGGVTASGVAPLADVWYRFRIEVEDTGARSEVRARIWADGTPEPGVWQIDAYDDSPTRLTSGTIGVWSLQDGGKHWDDLSAEPLFALDSDGDGAPDAFDNCSEIANGPDVPDAGGQVQHDVDGDGLGNVCDADFNQDGFVGGPDFDTLLSCFDAAVAPGTGPPDDPDCAESDMNGDGFVGGPDFDLFLARFDGPPGPGGSGACGLGWETAVLLAGLAWARSRVPRLR